MFCGECGAKNEKDAIFCAECGTKLEHEEETIEEKPKKKTKASKKEEPKEEVKEEIKGEVIEKEVVKEAPKKMSKKTRNILIVLLVVAGLLFAGYKYLEGLTGPKTVAKDYIKAVINNDLNKLYGYLELDKDKTFVSSKIFKELYKDKATVSEVVNYKITTVEYSDLTAIVRFVYTTKSSSDEKTGSVKLSKQPGHKYYLFDDWKIAEMDTDNLVLKDYKIKVIKDSKLTFAGIDVSTKYIDKDESTKTYDVYVLPQVFKAQTKIKVVLPSGLEMENTVTPSNYYNNHTVEFDKNSLTENQQEKIVSSCKKIITNIYNNVMASKTFEEVKEDYKDADSKFEENYSNLLSSLDGASSKLTKLEFTEAKLSDVSLNDDGNLVVKIRVNYDYTVEYTSYSDELKTSDRSDYSYITLILGNKDSDYYLVNIEKMITYFYR